MFSCNEILMYKYKLKQRYAQEIVLDSASPAIKVIRAPSPLEWILSHPVVDPRRQHLHVLCTLRMPNRRRARKNKGEETGGGGEKGRFWGTRHTTTPEHNERLEPWSQLEGQFYDSNNEHTTFAHTHAPHTRGAVVGIGLLLPLLGYDSNSTPNSMDAAQTRRTSRIFGGVSEGFTCAVQDLGT